MAKMYVDGIDDIQNALHATEDGVADFVDDLLAAGGEIAKEKVEQSILRHGHIRPGSGILLRSISIIRKTDKEGRKYVDVTAVGKRENGERNGEVAFVLNYGRSNYTGTHFWTEAEEQARKEYEELVNQKTNLFLKEKGLN